MPERPVALTVQKADGCPAVREGDRWLLRGRTLVPVDTAMVCVQAVCSFTPHLRELLAAMPAAATLPPMLVRCQAEGCATLFRAESLKEEPAAAQAQESVPAVHKESSTRMTRRLERGAVAAGSMLKESGTFLSRIPPHAAVQVVTNCEKVQYKNGQPILNEGVRGDRLYIVGDGKVEVVKRSPKDGSETILAVLGMGECFGEMSLLTGEPTSAAVRARGDAVIFMLRREKLDQLLVELPELNRVFSQLLAARLRAVNVTLESELDRGILGKLSMISMIDLVQTLNASRRTGTLVLTGQGKEANVIFRDGQVVGALHEDLKGEDAFHAVVSWPDGDFCFEQEQTEVPADAQIEMNTMSLLMEAMRRLDETRRTAAG